MYVYIVENIVSFMNATFYEVDSVYYYEKHAEKRKKELQKQNSECIIVIQEVSMK